MRYREANNLAVKAKNLTVDHTGAGIASPPAKNYWR